MKKSRRDGSDLSSTIARGWEDMRAAKEREWEDLGMCDDAYCRMRHVPCGARIMVLMGHSPICSKCQPEAWAEQRRKDGIQCVK
jgi:hypothetical protein